MNLLNGKLPMSQYEEMATREIVVEEVKEERVREERTVSRERIGSRQRGVVEKRKSPEGQKEGMGEEKAHQGRY